VTGSNLTDATGITIGGNACTGLTDVSATSATCTIPAGTAGDQNVIITTPGGPSSPYTYTYIATPTISTVDPVAGPLDGTNTLTITGTHLDDTNLGSITIDENACTQITVNSPTEVTCTAPSGTVGAKNIVLTNPGGTVTKTSAYTYAAAPEITDVTPDSGPASGTTTLTITGTGFLATTSVLVGGNACTDVTVTSATEVTCTAPAGTVGLVSVEITTPSGTDTATESYEYEPAPVIAEVSPTGGPIGGGGTLTITGMDLDDATVTIAGNSCTVATNTSTEITCAIPAGAAGARDVVVNATLGSTTLTGGYTYAADPAITSVSPTSGPAAGGNTVTINGTALAGATAVTIGGVACTIVTNTASVITCTAGTGTAGAEDVIVTTPGGDDTETDGYTYVTAPDISSLTVTSGPIAGGGTTIINGINLSGVTELTIGGNPCTLGTNTSTQVTCTIPAGTAGARDVIVTTAGGNDTLTGGYTYAADPAITSVSPTSGPTTGANTITINGTALANASSVFIGGVDCPIVTNTASVITCTAGIGTAGAKDVVVTTPGGDDTETGGYTYAADPAITSVSPTSGPTTGANTVTINGTALTGATAVTIGGVACTIVTNTASVITCTAGTTTAGAKDVIVTTPGGDDTETGGYTYAADPAITSVSPTSGPTTGANTVTINGTALTGATAVTIGGVACTIVTNTASVITCTAGTTTAGAKDVIVTTPGGDDTETGGYTYAADPAITSVSPTSGPTTGANTITINGTALTGATAVTIGGVACTIVTNTASVITCTAGTTTAGAKDVIVTTPGGDDTEAAGYTYAADPAITSVSPTSGPTTGANTITINGTALTGASSVFIGGVDCPIVTNTATVITCTAGIATAGAKDVIVTTPGGDDTEAAGYTYTAVSTPTTSPTTAPPINPIPTTIPTTSPTVSPSASPSTSPSESPSVSPSASPSDSPSPSTIPSLSSSPTPTTTPTPTTNPTPTAQPTNPPPTAQPTNPPAQIKLDLNLSLNEPIVGSEAVLSGGGLLAKSSYELIMYSTPVRLAGGYSDADGNFKTEITLPSKVCVSGGMHRMVLTATAADGSALSDTSYIVMDGTCKTRSLRQVKPVNNTVTLGALVFPVGSTTLPARSKATVRGLKSSFAGAKTITVTSYSETKKKSKAAIRANKVVATKRAAAVRTYLLSIGVKTKIVVVGVGGKPFKGPNRKYIRRAVITVRY
ncbi:IPT/TIG domain-containing protein, partial [Actinoplanes sp. ATCC 53533]|uniref:IPT/TIG domain-containing protein n=1 Tax=Actinoplanes sp. ATCC 53533 TaxID=1288362 RepID=UPI0011D0838F